MIYVMTYMGIGYMLYKFVEMITNEYVLLWTIQLEEENEEAITRSNNLVGSTGLYVPSIRIGKRSAEAS